MQEINILFLYLYFHKIKIVFTWRNNYIDICDISKDYGMNNNNYLK